MLAAADRAVRTQDKKQFLFRTPPGHHAQRFHHGSGIQNRIAKNGNAPDCPGCRPDLTAASSLHSNRSATREPSSWNCFKFARPCSSWGKPPRRSCQPENNWIDRSRCHSLRTYSCGGLMQSRGAARKPGSVEPQTGADSLELRRWSNSTKRGWKQCSADARAGSADCSESVAVERQ